MAEKLHAHVWGDAEAYEAYIGRWSRPVTQAFLAWLARAPGTHSCSGTINSNEASAGRL